jgi:hypothetical protein
MRGRQGWACAALKGHRVRPSYGTESGVWAAPFRRAPWPCRPWDSGQAAWPGLTRESACWGAWGALGAEKRPHRWECIAVARAKQAVRPDLDPGVRRELRPQPAEAGLGPEGADRGVLGLGILVLAGDRPSSRVRRRLVPMATRKRSGARAWRAGAPVPSGALCPPVPVPDRRGAKVKHGGLAQRLSALGAPSDGKRLDREQAIAPGGQPLTAIQGKPPGGPPGGPMGGVVPRPGAGVQHPEHPARSSDEPGLEGERSAGRC